MERLRNTLAKKVEEIRGLRVEVRSGTRRRGNSNLNTDLETKLSVFGKAIDALDVTIKGFKTAAHRGAEE